MKRITVPVLFLFSFLSITLSAKVGAAATMGSYCAIPPYVSQNVAPNIMLLVDNSGSMMNIAYACPFTQTTASGTSTTAVPVSSIAGFQPRQQLYLNTGTASAPTWTTVWVSSVDTTNSILNLTTAQTFAQGVTILDYGCSGAVSTSTFVPFYDTSCTVSDSAMGSVGAAQSCSSQYKITPTCDTVHTPKATVGTVSPSPKTTSTIPASTSTSSFFANESIVIVHGSTVTKATITSTWTSGSTSFSLTSSVTVYTGDVVWDLCYYNQTNGIGQIPVSSTGSLAGGEYIVIPNGTVASAPLQIDHISGNIIYLLSGQTIPNFGKTDSIYDYNYFAYNNMYPERSFDPTRTYYGYFDYDYYYTYGTSPKNTSTYEFLPSRVKAGYTKTASTDGYWDGNFLNWLTMRRYDIVRKVLTGGADNGGDGTTSGTKYDMVIGQAPDGYYRGVFKAVDNAQQYTGCTLCTGSMYFQFTNMTENSTNPSQFQVYYGNSAAGWSTDGNTYNVNARVPAASGATTVQGVLQQTVGTRARIGLAHYDSYNTGTGGKITVPVSGTSLGSIVSDINTPPTLTNTPLGEALWTVTGDFMQSGTSGGTGPIYSSGEYTVNAANDPLNYGSSTSPMYYSCATNYVLVITDGEPCHDGSLPASVLTTAAAGSPYICTGSNCPAIGPFPQETIPGCPATGAVAGLESVAYYAHTTNLRPSITPGIQNLNMYFIYAFGQGSTLLKYAAINGGFDITSTPSNQASWDTNNSNVPYNYFEASDPNSLAPAVAAALSTVLKRASSGTAASVLASGEGSGANILQAVFYPKRAFGNSIISWVGSLENLWYYIDPFFSNSQIREDTVKDQTLNLTNDYIAQLFFDTTSQSTKANLFADANGDGVADNPSTPTAVKSFEQLNFLWEAGLLLWRRDVTTNTTTGQDTSTDPRVIYTNCNITGGSCIGSTGLMAFTADTTTATALAPYLNLTDLNGNGSVVDEAQYLIRFVRGEGLTTVVNSNGTVTPGIDQNGDGIDDFRARTVKYGTSSKPHVWKLGDIVDSTPRLVSWLPLNHFNTVYGDMTYGPATDPPGPPNALADATHFVTTSQYENRGMVFTGANDGMLHAFKLGQLQLGWSGQQTPEKARLWNTDSGSICTTSSNGVDSNKNACGREIWAFIPKNVLPYLNYISDPNYCHIYSVDLSPYIFDASIGTTGCSATNYWDCPKSTVNAANNWRTILIGGMRTGGACQPTTTTSTSGNCSISGTPCSNPTTPPTACSGTGTVAGDYCLANFVDTPVNVGGTDVGYSSYFALDITDQNNPILLWEYSDSRLGFATTGPVIVRANSYPGSGNTNTPEPNNNGKWFVVFGSGPTGPIDPNTQQFLGRSNQTLKFFAVDLKTGPGTGNGNVTVIDTGIANAFAGSMVNANSDPNLDYQDEAVYAGYTSLNTSTNTWTNGGVVRLLTTSNTLGKSSAQTPANWTWSTVIDGIGPVTTSIARLEDTINGIQWLYFGTGRYFYDIASGSGPSPDDVGSRRQIFGIQDHCFQISGSYPTDYKTTCPAKLSVGSLTSVDNIANVPTSSTANAPSFNGWVIDLDAVDTVNNYGAERVITDPLALTAGVVLFTTYKPYSSTCSIGGKSYLWGVQYNNGGAPGAMLKGKAIIQVSTAAIQQIDMTTTFTDQSGRRSAAIEGVPPTAQGLSMISQPPPTKRTVHMRER